jgi:hypothetical protein
MEVGNFLTLGRARLRFLVAIGLIVAVGAGALVLVTQPRKYKATGVVFLASALGNADNTTVSTTVNDFKTAITLPEVKQRTAADANVSVSSLDGLSSSADDQGQTLKLSYTSTNRNTAANVVRVATRDALAFLFTQQQGAAQQRLTIAEDQYDAAAKALSTFQQKNNVGDVSDDIARRSDDILTLRSQIASGQGGAASSELLKQKQAELDNAVALNVPYQKLNADLNRANDIRTSAENYVDTISGRLATLDAKQSVVVPTPAAVSRVTELIPAVVAAIVAVVLVALLMAWSDRRRGRGPAAAPRRDPAAGPYSAEPGQRLVAGETWTSTVNGAPTYSGASQESGRARPGSQAPGSSL